MNKKLNIRTSEDELTLVMVEFAHDCYQQFIKHLARRTKRGWRFDETRSVRTAKSYGTMYFNAWVKLNRTGSISVLVNNEKVG